MVGTASPARKRVRGHAQQDEVEVKEWLSVSLHGGVARGEAGAAKAPAHADPRRSVQGQDGRDGDTAMHVGPGADPAPLDAAAAAELLGRLPPMRPDGDGAADAVAAGAVPVVVDFAARSGASAEGGELTVLRSAPQGKVEGCAPSGLVAVAPHVDGRFRMLGTDGEWG
eukprot:gene51921-34572_t